MKIISTCDANANIVKGFMGAIKSNDLACLVGEIAYDELMWKMTNDVLFRVKAYLVETGKDQIEILIGLTVADYGMAFGYARATLAGSTYVNVTYFEEDVVNYSVDIHHSVAFEGPREYVEMYVPEDVRKLHASYISWEIYEDVETFGEEPVNMFEYNLDEGMAWDDECIGPFETSHSHFKRLVGDWIEATENTVQENFT